jgi:hypothetical protein
MRSRTRAGLLTRLERLECRAAAHDHRVTLRFGHLKRLPRDYQGERHVIITRELPKQGDQDWVEFEGAPGPDPDPPRDPTRGSPHRIDIMFVEAYPYTETALESCCGELQGGR